MMKTVVPKISAAIWVVWILTSLVLSIALHSPSSAIDMAIKTFGVVLSIALSQKQHRALFLGLAAVSLFAFWRFYLGEVVFNMHPKLFGFTFAQSVADWWQRNTTTFLRFITVIPFGLFAAISFVFWSICVIVPASRASEEPSR